LLAVAATSNIATTSRDQVSLISAANSTDNGNLRLALKFQLAPGWHIYWSNPGDAGLPPQIALTAPASAGPFAYPPPEFLLQDSVAAYVLSGDVLLPFTATGITGNTITATVNWLVCSDICVPEHATLTIALTGGASAEAALFKPPTIAPSPFPATIAPDGTLTITGPSSAQVKAAHVFPDHPGIIINNAPQKLAFTNTGLSLKLTPAPGFNPATPLTGLLELTDPSGNMQALILSAAPGTAPATTPLIAWLGLAFLGGLILNLMPCVFPILAMKFLALARLSAAERTHVRREAFGYTAGILTAMLALALLLISLRAAGNAIGWGFQLQSPIFIAAMALLVLAIALNLAGAFSIPGFGNLGNNLARQSSFFTGLLAVAVATPCTAPFMGGAIAAALAASLSAAISIFLLLGLGLAAPFLLLAFIPAAAAILPRPGAWMLWLQRLLSLPMFATFLWLAWVFSQQISTAPQAISLPGAQPYSAARLTALRAAHQPVFVDMTAAWCITCLVNERTTLASPAIKTAFAKSNTKLLVGDWTSRDPEITNFLQTYHRDGVPLYVYFPPNAAAKTLPQILTPSLVESALK
jgi:thiol:disulfide interchange protein DsbD